MGTRPPRTRFLCAPSAPIQDVAGMIGRKKIHLLTILRYDRQPWQRHKLTVRLNWINTIYAFGGLLGFISSQVERGKGGKRFFRK